MSWQNQTFLCHPGFTSSTCENDVSSKFTFAHGFDDKPALLCLSVAMF